MSFNPSPSKSLAALGKLESLRSPTVAQAHRVASSISRSFDIPSPSLSPGGGLEASIGSVPLLTSKLSENPSPSVSASLGSV